MRLYIKPLLVAIFAIFIFLGLGQSNFASAQTVLNQYGETLTRDEIQQIEAELTSENNSCPEPVKQYFLNKIRNGDKIYGRGSFIVAYSDEGQTQPVVLTCANASVLQKIIIRVFVLLFVLLGLAFAFGIGRATVMIMTAFGNEEQFGEGVKGLVNAVVYTIGVLFAYSIFVFVAVGVLGIGTNAERPEYNLFCQNRIIVNLTFDQATEC